MFWSGEERLAPILLNIDHTPNAATRKRPYTRRRCQNGEMGSFSTKKTITASNALIITPPIRSAIELLRSRSSSSSAQLPTASEASAHVSTSKSTSTTHGPNCLLLCQALYYPLPSLLPLHVDGVVEEPGKIGPPRNRRVNSVN